MARKERERKSTSSRGGSAYQQGRGFVGTLIHWPAEERQRAKCAAVLSGCTLQEFCRQVLSERAAAVLAERGVQEKEK